MFVVGESFRVGMVSRVRFRFSNVLMVRLGLVFRFVSVQVIDRL